MNWIERQGTHFSGNYRVCRTTQGFFDVWYYSQDKSGVVQKGFKTATEAKDFAHKRDSREQELMRSLDAVSLK